MMCWNAEACGNTFRIVFAENTHDRRPYRYLENLRRHGRWNFDTALLLTPSSRETTRMHVLERDGSRSAMCGNGIRAAARVLRSIGRNPTIDTGTAMIEVVGVGPGYYSFPSHVHLIRQLWIAPLSVKGYLYSISGEPHIVIIVPDVDEVPLHQWGCYTVPHANCTVVSIHNSSMLYARTFERGVNKVTASCGTGACAAAHAIYNLYGTHRRCCVRMQEHSLFVEIHAHRTHLTGQATISPVNPKEYFTNDTTTLKRRSKYLLGCST